MPRHKKHTDNPGDSSSSGSIMDDTDREVSCLTDRAFRSLCLAEEEALTELQQKRSPGKSLQSTMSNQVSLNHITSRSNFLNRLSIRASEHTKWATTFQQAPKSINEERKGSKKTSTKPSIVEFTVPDLRKHSQRSKVSSLIKTFDNIENEYPVVSTPGTPRTSLKNSQKGKGQPACDQEHSTVLSNQNEVSEFSDSCHENYWLNEKYDAQKRKISKNRGQTSHDGLSATELSAPQHPGSATHGHPKKNLKHQKDAGKESGNTSSFLHSEHSAFKSWSDHHKKHFEPIDCMEWLTEQVLIQGCDVLHPLQCSHMSVCDELHNKSTTDPSYPCLIEGEPTSHAASIHRPRAMAKLQEKEVRIEVISPSSSSSSSLISSSNAMVKKQVKKLPIELPSSSSSHKIIAKSPQEDPLVESPLPLTSSRFKPLARTQGKERRVSSPSALPSTTRASTKEMIDSQKKELPINSSANSRTTAEIQDKEVFVDSSPLIPPVRRNKVNRQEVTAEASAFLPVPSNRSPTLVASSQEKGSHFGPVSPSKLLTNNIANQKHMFQKEVVPVPHSKKDMVRRPEKDSEPSSSEFSTTISTTTVKSQEMECVSSLPFIAPIRHCPLGAEQEKKMLVTAPSSKSPQPRQALIPKPGSNFLAGADALPSTMQTSKRTMTHQVVGQEVGVAMDVCVPSTSDDKLVVRVNPEDIPKEASSLLLSSHISKTADKNLVPDDSKKVASTLALPLESNKANNDVPLLDVTLPTFRHKLDNRDPSIIGDSSSLSGASQAATCTVNPPASDQKQDLGTAFTPWRRGKVKQRIQQENSKDNTKASENVFLPHRPTSAAAHVAETKQERPTSDISSSFNITRLLTPIIQRKNITEALEDDVELITPPPGDISTARDHEPRVVCDGISRETYRAKASSLLFNIKDVRKRIKSTYSTSPLNKQSDEQLRDHGRIERERGEKGKMDKGKVEKRKKEIENVSKMKEQETLEKEAILKERLARETSEKEIMEKEKLEREKLEMEKLEKEKLKREKLEKEKLEREILMKEKLERELREKQEREKMMKLEQEKLQREKIEKHEREKMERLEREKIEREKWEKLERERIEKKKKEKQEREKIIREKFERENMEKQEREKSMREKIRMEKIEKEREEKEKTEREKSEREKNESETNESEKNEREKIEREKNDREKNDREKNDREKNEREKNEREKIEREKIEREKIEREKLEREHLEKKKMAKLEQEKNEREKNEREKIEREKIEREKNEREKLEREHLEKKKMAKLEQEKLEREKNEREKNEREKTEREKNDREKIEREKIEREKNEREKIEREKIEREKNEREKIEREKIEREKNEREKNEWEKLEREHLEKKKMAKLEQEKLEREKNEREKNEREKNEREKIERKKNDMEQLEREHLEKKKIAKLEQEKLEREKNEREKIEREKIDREKIEREKNEREKIERGKNDREKLEIEHLEKKKMAKLAQEKIEREKIEEAERKRIERENIEKDRIQKEKLEKDEMKRERLEKEYLEKLKMEKAEKEKTGREKVQEIERKKLEKELFEREKLEREKRERLERERLDMEKIEKEKIEREKLEKDKTVSENIQKERIEGENIKTGEIERVNCQRERQNEEMKTNENGENVNDQDEKSKIDRDMIGKSNDENERLERGEPEMKMENNEREQLDEDKIGQEKMERNKEEQIEMDKTPKAERERIDKLKKENFVKQERERNEVERVKESTDKQKLNIFENKKPGIQNTEKKKTEKEWKKEIMMKNDEIENGGGEAKIENGKLEIRESEDENCNTVDIDLQEEQKKVCLRNETPSQLLPVHNWRTFQTENKAEVSGHMADNYLSLSSPQTIQDFVTFQNDEHSNSECTSTVKEPTKERLVRDEQTTQFNHQGGRNVLSKVDHQQDSGDPFLYNKEKAGTLAEDQAKNSKLKVRDYEMGMEKPAPSIFQHRPISTLSAKAECSTTGEQIPLMHSRECVDSGRARTSKSLYLSVDEQVHEKQMTTSQEKQNESKKNLEVMSERPVSAKDVSKEELQYYSLSTSSPESEESNYEPQGERRWAWKSRQMKQHEDDKVFRGLSPERQGTNVKNSGETKRCSSALFKPSLFAIKDNRFKSSLVTRAVKLPLPRSLSEDCLLSCQWDGGFQSGDTIGRERLGFRDLREAHKVEEKAQDLNTKQKTSKTANTKSNGNGFLSGFRRIMKQFSQPDVGPISPLKRSDRCYSLPKLQDDETDISHLLSKTGKSKELEGKPKLRDTGAFIHARSISLESCTSPEDGMFYSVPSSESDYRMETSTDDMLLNRRGGSALSTAINDESMTSPVISSYFEDCLNSPASAVSEDLSHFVDSAEYLEDMAFSNAFSPMPESIACSFVASPRSENTTSSGFATAMSTSESLPSPTGTEVTLKHSPESVVASEPIGHIVQNVINMDNSEANREGKDKLYLLDNIDKMTAKPPTVPPKTEKALRRAKRLASKRRKNEVQQQKKTFADGTEPVLTVPSPMTAAPSPLALTSSLPSLVPHTLDFKPVDPVVLRHSGAASLTPVSQIPLTQRKLLQDPDSGQYFVVDVPVQVHLKTFYDPDTGKYIQVSVPSSNTNLMQSSSMEGLNSPYMVYPEYLPLSVTSLPPTRSSSQLSAPATLMHDHLKTENREVWNRDLANRDFAERHPYIEPVCDSYSSSPYSMDTDSYDSRRHDIISIGDLDEFAVEGIS